MTEKQPPDAPKEANVVMGETMRQNLKEAITFVRYAGYDVVATYPAYRNADPPEITARGYTPQSMYDKGFEAGQAATSNQQPKETPWQKQHYARVKVP